MLLTASLLTGSFDYSLGVCVDRTDLAAVTEFIRDKAGAQETYSRIVPRWCGPCASERIGSVHDLAYQHRMFARATPERAFGLVRFMRCGSRAHRPTARAR